MAEQGLLSPAQITAATIEASVTKAALGPLRQFMLGVLAGVYIAFASEGSNMAAFNLLASPQTFGLGKALAGAIFGIGLMLVILAGGELFTGNALMLTGVLSRRIRIGQMLQNWFFVYLGNFAGSLLIVHMLAVSGLFNSGDSLLGGVTIRIAAYKTGLPFLSVFYLGILCNWLVCLAVWLATGARDMTGKILAIFFPIWLFITSGFEHSIANMYYIPAGILAKSNATWAAAANLSPDRLAGLNWQAFLVRNLLPVTLGNIIGGAFFVGTAYWFIYHRKAESARAAEPDAARAAEPESARAAEPESARAAEPDRAIVAPPDTAKASAADSRRRKAARR